MSEKHEAVLQFMGDVRRMELKPGDVVVVKLLVQVDDVTMERVKEIVMSAIPGHNVLVLPLGIDVHTLTPAGS